VDDIEHVWPNYQAAASYRDHKTDQAGGGRAQGLAQANGQRHTSNESSPHKAVEEFRLTYCGDSKTKYFMKFGPEMNEAANAMQASRPLKFPTRANPGWERVSRVRCVLITFQNQSVVNPTLWITCERN
jgi:hypothetical protein